MSLTVLKLWMVLNWYLVLDNEHFLHFNWAGNMLNVETVFLCFKLHHMAMPELEGIKCGVYVNSCLLEFLIHVCSL